MGASSDSGFTIRPLAPADAGALEAMYDAFEPRGGGLGLPPASREKTRRWLREVSSRSRSLVAEHGARLVGHALLADSGPGEAELAVFVRQEFRGRGLGTRLAQAAVALARREGYRRLWAAASPANEAAFRMVRRCGFERRAGAAAGDHEMELYLRPRDTTMQALNPLSYQLPGDLPAQVAAAIDDWRRHDKVRRLWQRDPTVWTNTDEAGWLGWLAIVDSQLHSLDRLEALARDVRQAGFTHALLLGMGGSSLCPEVLRMTFGHAEGHPELLVLDSTDPAQVRSFERRVALESTLFIVSSKSGTTLEPNLFKRYFFERLRQALGPEQAARHFMAITDPGTELDEEARAAGYWRVFYGVPDIGGRFSALSDFGMAPAAIMGLDTKRLLESAGRMAAACRPEAPLEANPGVVLGAILGTLATAGRDKLTLVASPPLGGFGAWLEQLVAESTGKDEKAIIPVDQEPLASPESYGSDRVFVYLRLEPDPDPAQDAAVAALEQAGHPVIRIRVAEPYELGQEFFRWELATAVAGAILGINPFNQPDVVFSKTETKKLTGYYERTGALPREAPMLEEGGLKLFADPADAPGLLASGRSLTACLRTHLGRIAPGDYFALLAYLEMRPDYAEVLQAIRTQVRDRLRVATCVGFGPRFLHSTGQAYKAGPNTGVFLQITCEDAADLAVPGLPYTFGIVKAAQARGDFQVLVDRGRRALRVHLGCDVLAGLEMLRSAIGEALA